MSYLASLPEPTLSGHRDTAVPRGSAVENSLGSPAGSKWTAEGAQFPDRTDFGSMQSDVALIRHSSFGDSGQLDIHVPTVAIPIYATTMNLVSTNFYSRVVSTEFPSIPLSLLAVIQGSSRYPATILQSL